MKKLPLILILILSFAVIAFPQSKSNDEIAKQIKSLKIDKAFTLSYDADGANSKIMVIAEDFGSKQDDAAGVQAFNFGMAFFYPGKILTAPPDTINLTFMVLAKKPKFAETNKLRIDANGESLDLGDARYVSKPDRKMEYLNFKISRADLLKLAKSSTANLKLGTAEFQFSTEHMRIFGAMAKISDPAELP